VILADGTEYEKIKSLDKLIKKLKYEKCPLCKIKRQSFKASAVKRVGLDAPGENYLINDHVLAVKSIMHYL